jgi:hypothetical protein
MEYNLVQRKDYEHLRIVIGQPISYNSFIYSSSTYVIYSYKA